MTLIVFIFILSILILVHEWGHYITARKCRVKVEQFALGFGPKLFSWMHDDTEFCWCAIPLGGFVKMAGDERDKCTGKNDEYFAKSHGQRALIILMGPVVNLILAYVCFWFVFMIGYVDMDLSQQKMAPTIDQILDHSPAQLAGLQTGDRILSIDGKTIDHWSQLQDMVTDFNRRPALILNIQRAGHNLRVVITPQQQDTTGYFWSSPSNSGVSGWGQCRLRCQRHCHHPLWIF